MQVIRIKNLRLRTIIGIFDWERENKQDVILNLTIEINAPEAGTKDHIDATLDYKTICKNVIQLVEASSYQLIETMAYEILKRVLESPMAVTAEIEIDKPHALRFADSVSYALTLNRDELYG